MAMQPPPPPQPVQMQNANDMVAQPGAVPQPDPPPPAAKPPVVGSTLPDMPMTPEAQMEAIRKRIEERRAQLREEAERQKQSPPGQQNPAP
jgi:general secretion pathway protein N